MPTSATLIPPPVIFAGLSITRATQASYCEAAAPLVGTTPHASAENSQNEIRSRAKKIISSNIERCVGVDEVPAELADLSRRRHRGGGRWDGVQLGDILALGLWEPAEYFH